jgi:predicted nucleotidyltransferase component of viral defense system
MITTNPTQLKAFIRKKAQKYNLTAQFVMQNYMMERLLERISLSEYRQNFIIKGGFLIAAIVGLGARATMDLDTTVKGLSLTHESVRAVFKEFCAIDADDDIRFALSRVTDIREGDDYPGLRVKLTANYDSLAVPLTVDVTTGDKITPSEIMYTFKLQFDDRTISMPAYNLETILAEKLETVLSRNVTNTRARDFYDIHVRYALRSSECDFAMLKQALSETSEKRGSLPIMPGFRGIVDDLRENENMRMLWDRYRQDFGYVGEISFDDALNTVLKIMEQSGIGVTP